MLIVNISENRVMYIYARIRKVINIYKIWKKKKKKIFRNANHSRHIARSLPPSPPFWKLFTFYVVLLVITLLNLSKFLFSFFFTMLCYQFLYPRINNWFPTLYTYIFLYIISSPVNYFYAYLYNSLVYLFIRTLLNTF